MFYSRKAGRSLIDDGAFAGNQRGVFNKPKNALNSILCLGIVFVLSIVEPLRKESVDFRVMLQLSASIF